MGALTIAGLTEGTNDAAGYVLVGALLYGGMGAGIGVGVDARPVFAPLRFVVT